MPLNNPRQSLLSTLPPTPLALFPSPSADDADDDAFVYFLANNPNFLDVFRGIRVPNTASIAQFHSQRLATRLPTCPNAA
uniref:Uncharacterized protein n=1 Tax=Mycena chlorophos TaxID=658473 RepID=A0ABQ0L2T5_MYCCL|nr:predicted protein [Mycena chlorophos]